MSRLFWSVHLCQKWFFYLLFRRFDALFWSDMSACRLVHSNASAFRIFGATKNGRVFCTKVKGVRLHRNICYVVYNMIIGSNLNLQESQKHFMWFDMKTNFLNVLKSTLLLLSTRFQSPQSENMHMSWTEEPKSFMSSEIMNKNQVSDMNVNKKYKRWYWSCNKLLFMQFG